MMQKIIVIGATSFIAEHCTRLWLAEAPKELHLVGRNEPKLRAIAADLRIRSPDSKIECYELDFLKVNQIEQFVKNQYQERAPEIILIAHGVLPNQLLAQSDLRMIHQSLNINAISPVIFMEAFAKRMAITNFGMLAVVSSVAGDRGRKSNYIYGAAKGMINRYIEGMQHRFSGTKVKIVNIKPGPTATPMTRSLQAEGVKMAPVKVVANTIVRGLKTSRTTIYAPARWQLIMLIIRHLPKFIFDKLDI